MNQEIKQLNKSLDLTNRRLLVKEKQNINQEIDEISQFIKHAYDKKDELAGKLVEVEQAMTNLELIRRHKLHENQILPQQSR